MTPSPDIAILRHLAGRIYDTAPEIARACKLGLDAALAHLAVLESLRLVSGRQDPDSKPARRVYIITDEGRRRAGV